MTEPRRGIPPRTGLRWAALTAFLSCGLALGQEGCAGRAAGAAVHPQPSFSAAPTALSSEASSPRGALPPPAPTAPPGILIPSLTPPSICPLLWLGRPIPQGFDQRIDTSYPFGSTEGETLEPHHGIDLPNPLGTPVVAAASGTVVFAGDDDQVLLGPSFGFYGNAVVLQLDRQTEGRPIFLLQGHLNDISIKAGQHVSPGDLIGRVGLTGVAIGAHLHFEVRVGTNEYTSVRNPELWLAPRTEAGMTLGALAGRVVDSSGNMLPGRTVTLRKWDGSGVLRTVRYLTTYELEPGTSGSDDSLQENFAATDLEPGSYQISAFSSKLQSATVTVKPGKLSWVDLGSGQDPLPACAP